MSQELVVPEATQGRGPRALFQVRFAGAMGDPDIARLARTLDLTMHPNATSLGAVRLDHQSGLFLARGDVEGQWVLEARTWGHPDPVTVHDWQVLAAGAARLFDPDVVLPERLAAVSPEYPLRTVGRAANKRSARFGRHILGL